MNSLQDTDAAAAAVATAPRVSLADIEAAIERRWFITAAQALLVNHVDTRDAGLQPLTTMTLCIVLTKNGFVVVGKSAPAHPDNFSAGLGQKFAYADALRQLWPLMGFNLRQRLHEEEQ